MSWSEDEWLKQWALPQQGAQGNQQIAAHKPPAPVMSRGGLQELQALQQEQEGQQARAITFEEKPDLTRAASSAVVPSSETRDAAQKALERATRQHEYWKQHSPYFRDDKGKWWQKNTSTEVPHGAPEAQEWQRLGINAEEKLTHARAEVDRLTPKEAPRREDQGTASFSPPQPAAAQNYDVSRNNAATPASRSAFPFPDAPGQRDAVEHVTRGIHAGYLRDDLEKRMIAAKVFPSFTTAAANAWDKDIRRKEDGRWDMPFLTQAWNKGAALEAVNGITGLANTKLLGQRLDDAGFGTDKEAIQQMMYDFQKAHNLSDEEVKAVWADKVNEYRPWDEEEVIRVMSDGQIVASPLHSAILHDKRMEQIVAGAGTSDYAKRQFLQQLPQIQRKVAENKGMAYAAADSHLLSLSDVAERMKLPEFDPRVIRAYEEDVAATDPAVLKYPRAVWDKLAIQGGAKIWQGITGAAGVLGFDAAGKLSADIAEADALVERGSTDIGLAGTILKEAPSLAVQILLTRGVGMGANALGASARTAQGIATMGNVAMAGMQSAGLTFGDAYREGLERGLSKEEALAEARSTSWKSGVSTALITGLFGTGKGGGVESVAVGRKAAGLTLRDLGALARKQGVADVLRSPSFRKMLGETLVHAGGEATEEGIDQLAQAFLHQKPDTNLAEAWNQAVEAMKVGGALGASTHTASSAIERGHTSEQAGVASNGWRALPANLGDSFSTAAPLRGAMASSPAASSAMMPGGGSPHDLAARFAKEWSMAAPSAAAPGAMRNASGRPARPAPLHAEHSLSTGGIVGGVGSVYAAPSTPSTPRDSSPAAPAARDNDAGETAGEPPAGALPMEEAQGVASPAPVLSPQASAAGDTQAPNGTETNKRLTKEQQTAVRALGNIRNDLSRMRERLQRSDLKPELRESLEKGERHYAAKEAEFAAKVEGPAFARPQAAEEMPALAGAEIGEAADAMRAEMGSGRSMEPVPYGTPSQTEPLVGSNATKERSAITPQSISERHHHAEGYLLGKEPVHHRSDLGEWDEKQLNSILLQLTPIYRRVFKDALENPGAKLSEIAKKHGIDALTVENILTALRTRIEANTAFARSIAKKPLSPLRKENQNTISQKKLQLREQRNTSTAQHLKCIWPISI